MEFKTIISTMKKLRNNPFVVRAWGLFLLELMFFLSLAGGIGGIFYYFNNHCWFRHGPVDVIGRYYIEEDKRIDLGPFPDKRTVGNGNIKLGVELLLTKKCYCPGGEVYAEIHNFQPGDGVPWVEVKLGSGNERLEPQNDEATILEGKWLKLPHGIYMVELHFRCSSRPESIPIPFAVFNKE
ncbi:MAG: hypothetical protein KDI79_20640 [Anaerolineae bacterium]|nr:hypothetical protein [Anaerolineae bacterium]